MKSSFPQEAKEIMQERFGHDTLLSVATVDGDMPYVRTVNAWYEDGAFYVITYGLSNKIAQLRKNPNVAVCGDWFTAHGQGVNLGWFCKEENKSIAEKLKAAFASWIGNGHNDFEDETPVFCASGSPGVCCFPMVPAMIWILRRNMGTQPIDKGVGKGKKALQPAVYNRINHWLRKFNRESLLFWGKIGTIKVPTKRRNTSWRVSEEKSHFTEKQKD